MVTEDEIRKLLRGHHTSASLTAYANAAGQLLALLDQAREERDAVIEELGKYQDLAEKLGEPGWCLLDGREHQELGPGWHVMEAECNVYSVTRGEHDAPCEDDHHELAKALCELLDGLTSRRFDGKPGAYR